MLKTDVKNAVKQIDEMVCSNCEHYAKGGTTQMRLIDADALVRHICAERCGCEPHECGMEHDGLKMCDCVNYVVENAPIIDAELVRHSAWIKMSDRYGYYFCCNSCGYDRTEHKYSYCPSCGAKMDEE